MEVGHHGEIGACDLEELVEVFSLARRPFATGNYTGRWLGSFIVMRWWDLIEDC